MNNNCKLCKKRIDEKNLLKVKEQMFWTNEEFTYWECEFCWAISLQDNIIDFSKYYDKSQYYSMVNIQKSLFHTFKIIYWNILYRPWILSNIILGILTIFYRVVLKEVYESIKIEKRRIKFYTKNWLLSNKHVKILDVWSGEWHRLLKLESLWFKNLTWLDPYIEKTHRISSNIELIKEEIDKFPYENYFDLINLSHSLEHMYDHDKIINKIARFVKKSWVIMISIPIKNKAYEIYKESWFQIDAPRHIIIHTVESFKKTIERNWLEIIDHIFDSWAKQFFISEFYKKNISMYDWSKKWLRKYNFSYYMRISELYNEKSLWDQAIFLLKKKDIE